MDKTCVKEFSKPGWVFSPSTLAHPVFERYCFWKGFSSIYLSFFHTLYTEYTQISYYFQEMWQFPWFHLHLLKAPQSAVFKWASRYWCYLHQIQGHSWDREIESLRSADTSHTELSAVCSFLTDSTTINVEASQSGLEGVVFLLTAWAAAHVELTGICKLYTSNPGRGKNLLLIIRLDVEDLSNWYRWRREMIEQRKIRLQ
jgi:hypothetical protein